MDEQFKEHSRSIDRKFEEQSRAFAKKFEDNDNKFEELMKLMREMSTNRSTEVLREETNRASTESNRNDITANGEAEQESKDVSQEVTPNLVDCNEVRGIDIACNGNINNSSEGSGISDLEKMLQQKTFTRSEIDHLTELLHSRTTESSYQDKEKTNEGNLYKSVSDIEKHNVSARSQLQESKDNGIKLQRDVTVTGVSSKVLEDDIASPAELAKAYMGRSSKVSPSMLGVRSQAFKEETPLLNHAVFPSKSSAPSLVSKSVLRDGAPDKSFTTPRSRGRSAIYNMARTPYSRGTGSTNYITVFGSTTALRSPGNNSDQMDMEDSMAEDPVHSSNPAVPVFGQSLVSPSNPTVPVFGQPNVSSSNAPVSVFGGQPLVSSSNPTVPAFGQSLVSPSPPGFMFGSAAPSSPFQFGGQQNQATSQNLPSFPASNSLVNSGGSFSLGSGGGDKGGRKIVRVSKNKNRRK